MSTLKADTIQSTGGGAATLTKQHANKVWASVQSSNGGFNDSFNCSSLADNGTGDGTPSFTNAMSDANYAHNLGHRPGSLTSSSSNQRNMHVESVAAGNINLINSYTSTGGAIIFYDVNHAFSINGDLA
jgi:hypothetical protein